MNIKFYLRCLITSSVDIGVLLFDLLGKKTEVPVCSVSGRRRSVDWSQNFNLWSNTELCVHCCVCLIVLSVQAAGCILMSHTWSFWRKFFTDLCVVYDVTINMLCFGWPRSLLTLTSFRTGLYQPWGENSQQLWSRQSVRTLIRFLEWL